jgi:hypothetical protein
MSSCTDSWGQFEFDGIQKNHPKMSTPNDLIPCPKHHGHEG